MNKSDPSVLKQYFQIWEQELGKSISSMIASGPEGIRDLVELAFASGYCSGIHYTSEFEPKREEPLDE